MGLRVSQVALESLAIPEPSVRVSQAVVEVLFTILTGPTGRTSQAVVEYLLFPPQPEAVRRRAVVGTEPPPDALLGKVMRAQLPASGEAAPVVAPEGGRFPRSRKSRKQFHRPIPPVTEEINNAWLGQRQWGVSPQPEPWRGGWSRRPSPVQDPEIYRVLRRAARSPHPEPEPGRVFRRFAIGEAAPHRPPQRVLATSPHPEPPSGAAWRRPTPGPDLDLYQFMPSRRGVTHEPPPASGAVWRGRLPGAGETSTAVIPPFRLARTHYPPEEVLDGSVRRGLLWHTGESPEEGVPFTREADCPDRRVKADESTSGSVRPDGDADSRRKRADEGDGLRRRAVEDDTGVRKRVEEEDTGPRRRPDECR
jgi:hypothetical protein